AFASAAVPGCGASDAAPRPGAIRGAAAAACVMACALAGSSSLASPSNTFAAERSTGSALRQALRANPAIASRAWPRYAHIAQLIDMVSGAAGAAGSAAVAGAAAEPGSFLRGGGRLPPVRGPVAGGTLPRRSALAGSSIMYTSTSAPALLPQL